MISSLLLTLLLENLDLRQCLLKLDLRLSSKAWVLTLVPFTRQKLAPQLFDLVFLLTDFKLKLGVLLAEVVLVLFKVVLPSVLRLKGVLGFAVPHQLLKETLELVDHLVLFLDCFSVLGRFG